MRLFVFLVAMSLLSSTTLASQTKEEEEETMKIREMTKEVRFYPLLIKNGPSIINRLFTNYSTFYLHHFTYIYYLFRSSPPSPLWFFFLVSVPSLDHSF